MRATTAAIPDGAKRRGGLVLDLQIGGDPVRIFGPDGVELCLIRLAHQGAGSDRVKVVFVAPEEVRILRHRAGAPRPAR